MSSLRILSRGHLNAIHCYWLAILAGAIVALTGFAMSLNTFCVGVSPYALYWMCENYAALVVTLAGSLIMVVAGILLSRTLFKSRSLAARSEKNTTSIADNEWSTSKRQKATRTWTLVIIAIAIGSILLTTSAARAAAWQAYITKIPLHVGIEGLNNTHKTGEKIDFYVILEGYGYDCGFPDISVWKFNAEKTASEKTIWQQSSGDGSSNRTCSIFPADVPKQVVHVGGSKPLMINETGVYVAHIKGGIGQEFEVVDEP